MKRSYISRRRPDTEYLDLDGSRRCDAPALMPT
jgi:hypothetical protein